MTATPADQATPSTRPAIWAISDLHLSQANADSRERFAGRWHDHSSQIAENWQGVVGRQDLVLIPGDLSMAQTHRDLQPDLVWLDRLPGLKVFSAGNHDRWFNRIEAIRPMLRPSLRAVGGDAIEAAGVIVCGTLGADVPEGDRRPPALKRQLGALDRALEHAASIRSPGQPLYVLWHYPPFDQHGRPGPAVEKFLNAGVTACVYGHLHAQGQWSLAVRGVVDGIRYDFVAADAVGFRPLKIGNLP